MALLQKDAAIPTVRKLECLHSDSLQKRSYDCSCLDFRQGNLRESS
jgi:hypothetical protein